LLSKRRSKIRGTGGGLVTSTRLNCTWHPSWVMEMRLIVYQCTQVIIEHYPAYTCPSIQQAIVCSAVLQVPSNSTHLDYAQRLGHGNSQLLLPGLSPLSSVRPCRQPQCSTSSWHKLVKPRFPSYREQLPPSAKSANVEFWL
jgi:hypothetical protein